MDTPKASIILLTLNESTNIGNCLEALRKQEFSDRIETILIDSGSADGTVEMVRGKVDQLIQIPKPEFHHARTRNLGASKARGEFLVYLAADARPIGSRWLATLLRNFSDPAVAGVHGRQIPRPGASIERRMLFEHRYPPQPSVKSGSRNCERDPHQHFHFSTVNAALRKSVWEASPFPDFCKTYEDLGMAKQLLDRGWKIVYEPEAAVIHSHNYTLEQGFRRSFDLGVVIQRLGLWDASGKSAFRRDGLRKAWRELRAAAARGEWSGAAYLGAYDAARYLGVVLGRNANRLPRAVQARLSFARLFEP